MRTKVVELIRR